MLVEKVLKDLPNKTERIEWCDMTDLQRSIYRDTLRRSRNTIVETGPEAGTEVPSGKQAKKPRPNTRPKDKLYSENSTNVLMDLRKAASHPMLFRTRFSDEILIGITKQLLKEPDFRKRGAIFDHVKEDMSVMTDAELQVFCATYKVRLTTNLISFANHEQLLVYSEIPPGSSVLHRCWESAGPIEPPCTIRK